MQLEPAPDIQQRITYLAKKIPHFSYIKAENLICFRSHEATSRARARIWSLPKIWQMGLSIEAHYCIEVLSQHFDNQSLEDQERILIHELLHIPKNFSGALVPHRTAHRRTFRHYHDEVEDMYRSLPLKSYE